MWCNFGGPIFDAFCGVFRMLVGVVSGSWPNYVSDPFRMLFGVVSGPWRGPSPCFFEPFRWFCWIPFRSLFDVLCDHLLLDVGVSSGFLWIAFCAIWDSLLDSFRSPWAALPSCCEKWSRVLCDMLFACLRVFRQLRDLGCCLIQDLCSEEEPKLARARSTRVRGSSVCIYIYI